MSARVVRLSVDGREVEVPEGSTVLNACEAAGAEIPRFCYHERLSIAGNCRMCLVEVEKNPKPVASCAMPAGEGMVVRTRSPGARRAREGVMEFLLANHPLDCPICDQGGECDLQDQALGYGRGRGRFDENKRAVSEKHIAPTIKTFMTRCIHCTRCVRFAAEIAGVEDLGLVRRGEEAEITTLGRTLDTEFSGCLVDVCPVGALTAAPHRFTARSWELRHADSIDVSDAAGSHTRVDSRGRAVMRVMPRVCEEINEEWIHDKARHACDALALQRLDRPWLRGADGALAPVSWAKALATLAERLGPAEGNRSAALAGDLVDCEALFALRALMRSLGRPSIDCRQEGGRLGEGPPVSWLFNTTIAGLERADAALLVGANPRDESPLVNLRLRKRLLAEGLRVGSVGPEADLTFPVERLGDGPAALAALADGAHPFARALEEAERPVVIAGADALARDDGPAVLALLRRLAERCGAAGPRAPEGWNGFNVLHRRAARAGALVLDFLPGEGGLDAAGILDAAESGALDALWLLGADEAPLERVGDGVFVVYQGHHGEAGAARADLVLPGAAWTEKDGLYVNMEGRAQEAERAVFPPGEAREDWRIVRAASGALGRPLPFDDLPALRAAMAAAAPAFFAEARRGLAAAAPWAPFGEEGAVSDAPFEPAVAEFHRTDVVSRLSPTMALCAASRRAARAGLPAPEAPAGLQPATATAAGG